MTVYVTIDRGVQAIGSVGGGACTLEGNGAYTYGPSQAETDGAFIQYTFIGSGAVPVTRDVYTISALLAAQAGSAAVGNTATTFNARSVITDAFLDLGIFGPADDIPAEDAQFGLRALNKFISSIALHNLVCPFTNREVFSVVANQGTYTIGPGGDFDTVRPMSLAGAGLLLPTTGATSGRLEIPVGVLTEDAWRNLSLKDMTNAQFTRVFYRPTYAGGLGSVFLWPTPSVATNDLVLYRGDTMQGFANLTTFYDFPPGYAEMFQFNLEKRLCRSYGQAREWGALDEALANDSIRFVKRANFKVIDAVLDGTLSRGNGYSIQTGNG